MLRGPQTAGELNQRTGRLHPFAGIGEIHETLERLRERELVERLARRPGQKEERYGHLLGADDVAGARATRGRRARRGALGTPGARSDLERARRRPRGRAWRVCAPTLDEPAQAARRLTRDYESSRASSGSSPAGPTR